MKRYNPLRILNKELEKNIEQEPESQYPCSLCDKEYCECCWINGGEC